MAASCREEIEALVCLVPPPKRHGCEGTSYSEYNSRLVFSALTPPCQCLPHADVNGCSTYVCMHVHLCFVPFVRGLMFSQRKHASYISVTYTFALPWTELVSWTFSGPTLMYVRTYVCMYLRLYRCMHHSIEYFSREKSDGGKCHVSESGAVDRAAPAPTAVLILSTAPPHLLSVPFPRRNDCCCIHVYTYLHTNPSHHTS